MKPPPHPAPTALRPGAGEAAVPGVTALRLVEVPPALPQTVATLTVFAAGDVNLNAEASRLLSGAEGLCLCPPPAVRPGRRPQLWEVRPGECSPVRGRPDRLAQLRFRVDPAEGPPAGRYLLLPVAGATDRYALWPG